MKTEITGYWTFFCNPLFWHIDKFLETNEKDDTFDVKDWHEQHIKPGHLGIIRVGFDNRSKKELAGRQKLERGIYGIVQTLDEPKMTLDKPTHYPDAKVPQVPRLQVKIHYLKNLLQQPLLLTAIEENPIINADQYLIQGFRSASMPLKVEAYNVSLPLTTSCFPF